jgi:endonuclease/exonuclease/phosphatase family metal-dependent hydrolase
MSFNVCGLPSALPPLAARATEFGRIIDESDIDVVALQEVWTRRALSTIRRALPSYPYLAWRRGLAGQPAGGLVTFSRRPFTAVSYRSYRAARAGAGSLGFRAGRAINGLLQGVLVAERAGLAVANTHLSANHDGDWSAENRHYPFQRRQLELWQETLRRADQPVMVAAGDFNIASDGPLYPHIVADGRWLDPFAATDPLTYHVELLPPGAIGHRIDYLLVRGDGVHVLECVPLFTERVGSTYLSDHVALTVRIAGP